MRTLHIAGIALFLLLLWAPAVQRKGNLFPGHGLDGVEPEPARPRLTPAGWFSGEFARQREAYDARRMGFRGPLVRTRNQILYSVFGDVPSGSGTRIVRGEDHWLYEEDYVRHYLAEGSMSPARLEAFARRLRELQDALAARNVAFVFLIAPVKTETYPEHLPAAVRAAPRRADTASDYARLAPLLARHGVNTVDGHRLFLGAKPAAAYPLFARGGTHWTMYGTCLALNATLPFLAAGGARPMTAPDCADVDLRPAEGADKDLGKLINVWRYPGADDLLPYPRPAPASAAPRPPDLLLVGDSFCFMMVEMLRARRQCGDLDLLYYNKRLYRYAAGGTHTDHARAPNRAVESAADIDWPGVVFAKRAIVLEANEKHIPYEGYGFVEAALLQLRRDASAGDGG